MSRLALQLGSFVLQLGSFVLQLGSFVLQLFKCVQLGWAHTCARLYVPELSCVVHRPVCAGGGEVGGREKYQRRHLCVKTSWTQRLHIFRKHFVQESGVTCPLSRSSLSEHELDTPGE